MRSKQTTQEKIEKIENRNNNQRMERAPQATTSATTRTRTGTEEKQKDGAKTLLDAVTAYQRRTARAERTAARNQTNHSNSNPSPRPSLSDRPTDSLLDSSDPRSCSQPAFHSRISPPTDPEHRSSRSNANSLHPNLLSPRRPQQQSTQLRPNGSSFPAKRSNPNGRNSPRAFSNEPHHSSKLFDPKLDSTRPSKRGSDIKPARSSPPRTSTSNLRQSHHHTHKGNPTQFEDQESSQSTPSQTSHPPACKSHPPHLRAIPTQQDRDWKRNKTAVRTNLNESRKLFDPRKHDPVTFATSKRPSNESKLNPSLVHNNNPADSLLLSTPQHHETGHTPIEDDGNNRNDLVIRLKQAYKRILSLETALKDEESAAKAKEEELRAREIREGLPFHSALSTTTKNGTSASLLRNHHQQRKYQEDYWVRLSRQHRELAEAHQEFLEMALDPQLPPSMHSLPHKYNTPSRLWQIGFHQLLERLRHALPTTSMATASSADHRKSGQCLLEHMTDFIYFAYGFYTALLEEQRLLPFKNVWIEQLGDLARYRMAVAGLTTRLATASQNVNDKSENDSEPDNVRPKPRGGHRFSQADEDEAPLAVEFQRTRLDEPSAETPSQVPLATIPNIVRPPSFKGSIGIAALDDWDCEEQEIWRATAQEWYAKGLADNPATGRLHHHLALLSKGDELRALYHYCKSLTVAHPYLPARESILPFFEQEHQARRSRPEVSINDLFVHLHGMLFTKIQLDDFDSELARFIEKLTEDRLLSNKQGRACPKYGRRSDDNSPKSTISDASWVMMATVNICAISQYGIDDSVIRVAQQANKSQDYTRNASNKPASKGVVGQTKPATIAPQAILLSHLSHTNTPVELRKMSNSMSSDEGVSPMGNGVDPSWTSNAQDHRDSENISADKIPDDEHQAILIKKPGGNENDEENEPIVFILATKFTFEMLKEVLQLNHSENVCPYLTIILTFLGSLSNNRSVMTKLEKFIPWDRLVSHFNRIPKSVQVRSPSCFSIQDSMSPAPSSASSHLRISGPPLLEDWPLRGMDWAIKGLFGRGHWRQPKSRGAAGVDSTSSTGEPEKQQLDHPSASHIDSELDALAALNGVAQEDRRINHRVAFDESILGSSATSNNKLLTYSSYRWKRIGSIAFWISRSIPGIECQKNLSATSPEVPMFILSHHQKEKILRWQVEFEQEEDERQLIKSQRIGSWHNSSAEYEDEVGLHADEEDDDEEEDDDPNESELVKSLKVRRKELLLLLNHTKNASAQPASIPTRKSHIGHKKKQPTEGRQVDHQRRKIPNNSFAKLNVVPGYTTLVFDTNILIGMLSMVKDLIESEQFTIIIPLVVITELDGLKNKINDSDVSSQKLGQEALEAIQYLENYIKIFSKVLKIQTSRGNYLRDLSIRNERINFQGLQGDSNNNNEFLTTNAARNLDDVVLRATSWQLEHFSNRLPSSSSIQPEDQQLPEKVILLTLDRNLRLKARARGILAADEKQIINLIGSIKQHQSPSQTNRHQTNQKIGKKD